ncbi:hypothetical protein HHI36_017521 [Cryptolaemus montrouzieri]|uniref:Uncharacterized protein n=1 Tax=Cryptolaemus montrouzieri TaxID=559131 RepID=A0ABD2NN56_9CUCU
MNFDGIHELDKEVMKFSENDKMLEHPKVHYGLNGVYLLMRGEIASIAPDLLQKRMNRLRKLFIEDFLEYDKELRLVDMAFIDTQL